MSHEVLQEDDSQTPDEDQVRGLYADAGELEHAQS
jgi:hypothetical protein